MHFTVETLTPTHWPRLRSLRLAALSDSSEIYGDIDLEMGFTAEQWQHLLDEQSWAALVVEGKDVGLVTAIPTPPDRCGDCWIKSWWIAHKYRGKGGARLLLNWLIELCKQNNWSTLALGVFETNTSAILSYERLGFHKVGIKKPSSRANTFFIIMAQEIKIG
ncbi:MAG: GNAT family N-acetyltransferase [Actinobacteria bacterium]|nr:GNAT family N-acetyltransferase [Actinomycetota bacterium]